MGLYFFFQFLHKVMKSIRFFYFVLRIKPIRFCFDLVRPFSTILMFILKKEKYSKCRIKTRAVINTSFMRELKCIHGIHKNWMTWS